MQLQKWREGSAEAVQVWEGGARVVPVLKSFLYNMPPLRTILDVIVSTRPHPCLQIITFSLQSLRVLRSLARRKGLRARTFQVTTPRQIKTTFLLPKRNGALGYFRGTRQQQTSQPPQAFVVLEACMLASESRWLLRIIFQMQESLSLEITLIPQSVQLISIITGIT